MSENQPNPHRPRDTGQRWHDEVTAPVATEEELRELAEDIVRYCPSLTQLLLALGSKGRSNPLKGMN